MENNEILRAEPVVTCVGHDYRIIFLTTTNGLGWVEIDGVQYSDEECGLPKYGQIHNIPVSGEALNKAKKYTVVFKEYLEKKPYFPKGEIKLSKEYSFHPISDSGDIRIFQFADTHSRVEKPLETYNIAGQCDLVVMNGDINDASDRIDQFYTTFEIAGAATKGEYPCVISRGNHDTRGYCAENLIDYTPTETRNGRRETFYTFRQGSLWGIVLDCGEDKYDTNEEYGGVVLFTPFRNRETEYIKSVIANADKEYNAPGVKHKIAFCHVPFVEHFNYPFDVADDIYEEWCKLLGEIGIDILVSGHMHQTYFIQPHDRTLGTGSAPAGGERALEDKTIKYKRHDASFPVAVMSIPEKATKYGDKTYIGGMVVSKDGERYAEVVPTGEKYSL